MYRLPYLKSFRKRLTDNYSGQALLIVLLTMAVVLTVVLSVVSRSVTDISVTTYEEDSQRAFDAAEAGIERVLLTGSDQSQPVGDAEFTASISSPLPQSDQVVYPSDVLAGESATFWFVSHDDNGQLVCSGDCLRANSFNVCWGKVGTPADQYTPAIEISLYYDTTLAAVSSGNYSGVKIARFAFDPASSRTASNHFTEASSNCSGGLVGRQFAFSTGNIQLNNSAPPNFNLNCPNGVGCLIMAKVRFLYNHNPATGESYPQPVGIEVSPQASTHLPAQGTQIDSVGISGDTTRKVNVFQGYPEPPFVFESALFGKGGLSKP